MDIATVALVVAALGVNFGWQPSAEDPQAYEVLMQVEPELVDVIADGRQIPLESHVPASVAPIRNIRVVVATEELPRKSIAEASNKKKSTELIVRGQEESPISHSANFQSDDGWSGDRYLPTTDSTRQYDQRGASIGVEPIRTAQNDPWTIDNAKQTATDAGNSLRDSFNSGIQQTNQQISDGPQKMLNSAQQSGSEFGQQLQDMTGFGSTSSAQPAAAATSRSSQSSWPAPPPLASPQASSPTMSGATAANAPGWSSIKSELAPPRLPTPSIPNVTRMASNAPSSRSAGPSFPPPPAASNQPLHSVLADPATSSSNSANQDWASVWGTSSTPTSSAHGSDVGVGMVPVAPRVNNAFPAPPTQTATVDPDAARWAWPSPTSSATAVTANSNPAGSVADDRYRSSVAGSASGADPWANFPQPASIANSGQGDRIASPPPSQVIPASGSQQHPAIGMQAPPSTTQANQQTGPRPEEVPWKPLLAVSLALAGSLGANLFLGWSYADARHRYLALVAKTTHTFQKAAGLAA